LQKVWARNFDDLSLPTTGIDYHQHSDEYLSYHIWDTAGQEAFEKITKSYMKQVDATLLVYDITDKDSFEKYKYWFEEVRRNDPNQLVFVIGNKVDLEDHRRIDKSEVERFCSENRVRH
jgi:small GTP-binding protein